MRKTTAFNGLNENQIDTMCMVQTYGASSAAPSTISSLLSRGLIERTGRAKYRCTESGAEIVRQIRAEMGE